MKYLFLIGLFISSFFNAQEALSEKYLKYYGVKSDEEFFVYLTLFVGQESRESTAFIDDRSTRYRLNWGYLHHDLKTISPIKSFYNLSFDWDKKKEIPVDFVDKEVINHLKDTDLGIVMYVTPRFESFGGYDERQTGVLLHFRDIITELVEKGCMKYFTLPDDQEMASILSANISTPKGRLEQMSNGLVSCTFRNKLNDTIWERMSNWGILTKRKWDNWTRLQE